MELDYEQYKLVREALHERATFLNIAPYLAYQLPIMLPLYKLWQLPYYWIGCKVYDLLSGKEALESSYILSKTKALEAFPMLRKDELVGALVYYDGQHNDSRMNVALALTAIGHGATVANHVSVVKLIKETAPGNSEPKIRGAVCRDMLTGKEWEVRCKGVINATGPFTDGIRKLDVPTAEEIVAPSSGVHIVLPNYYSPVDMGLLDPKTSDGRVIYFLPWQGGTIAGTTDSSTIVEAEPRATEDEINWILGEVRRYLSSDVKVRRGDVLAAWSGIRPLVRDPQASSTAGLVRNHMIHVTSSGLLTIAGGKWTTYRAMAEETVDRAIQEFQLEPVHNSCSTETVPLIGSQNYSKTMFIKLIQHFGLETEVAQHLASSYGDRAWAVAAMARATGKRWPLFGKRLAPASTCPYIEAEVLYAVRREYACTPIDVLARRTRLAFLNAHAAADALPRVISIMAAELGWDDQRRTKEFDSAMHFLETMGLPGTTVTYPGGTEEIIPTHFDQNFVNPPRCTPAHFSRDELEEFRAKFNELDTDGDGAIPQHMLGALLGELGEINVTASDGNRFLGFLGVGNSFSNKSHGLVYPELEIATRITGVDRKGHLEFADLLDVVVAIREKRTADAATTDLERARARVAHFGSRLSTERSGGGV
jgi:glycerol-3-phosphate dehydrogenase